MPRGPVLQHLKDQVGAMLVACNIGVWSTPNSPKARFHGERPVVFSVGLPTIRSILPVLPEDAGRRDIAAASNSPPADAACSRASA
jgi:hypothetical protein